MPQNSRRKLLTGAVAAVAAAGAAKAQTGPQRKVIRKGPKPAKPDLFSQTVMYGNLVFVAGQGYHEGNDIKVHTKGVPDAIKQRLESAGSSMEKVLKVTVFLADLKYYDAMNEVYRGAWGDEPPVRTTVSVAGVPGNSLVEMDVIAYV